MADDSPAPHVIIIGAGLAGLACARALRRQRVPFLLLDAADAVGGRVRTDTVRGFRLDRGYQVLLTAYPETQRELDYDALDLRPYHDGALVRVGGRFHRVSDPFRHPTQALGALAAPIGGLGDKLRVARLRQDLRATPLSRLFRREETTTLDALRTRYGFSERMVDRFFRPFFGGIFLDRSLGASSRMFDFVFKMFSEGQTVLPADGIEAIPRWMARVLPEEALRLGTRVTALDGQTVTLEGGATLTAPHVVVATDAPAADALVGGVTPTAGRATTCVYYAALRSPLGGEPILALNGEGVGPINNLSVLTDVAPSYAPDDRALVSVAVVDAPEADGAAYAAGGALEEAVRRQCIDWFGAEAGGWQHLRTYRIPYALPEQAPPFLSPPAKPVMRRPGLYVCGDHARTASLNGALAAGRAAAEAILHQGRPVPAPVG